ncbi:helix-turn-helix domain-containing protein [Empedobacter falsenii]|uniref:XRE family transcriptional regulator n=1 Tax=Empedobacter falsenii TaxID=343874 RepID=A0A427BSQ1_9FLAO|nr:helix-turn-helix transcriptional regulator [Empedobacter falsenii]RRT94153.1 XRE family transcriptional regulator [Empedobacter falsenii]RRT94347.1 XRE family transcriptional regulator [Empedobacter falsenii]
MDDLTKKIILKLKEEFEKSNSSARSLGSAVGVSHTTITRMFSFETIPNFDIVVKISKELNVDLFK